MHNTQNVKNNLRILAFDREKNLSEISRATGISRNTLTAIYRNRSKYISFEVLDKLCNYFECEIGDFLVRTKSNANQTRPVA